MTEYEFTRLRCEAQQLRREYQELRCFLIVAVVAIAGLTLIVLSRPGPVMASTTDKDGVLHVRGLVVEDQGRHERVRLGAPLPDPIIHGARYKRSGVVSGRGYVTGDKSGEALLTLDSEDEQQVLFLANPKGGVNFDIFDSKGNEAQLTVFPSGPKFTMRKTKEKVLELPAPLADR